MGSNAELELHKAMIKIGAVLTLIKNYGGIDGSHHKDWVLDQVTRKLTGDEYEEFVAEAKAGEDGPDTYAWDVGIAP